MADQKPILKLVHIEKLFREFQTLDLDQDGFISLDILKQFLTLKVEQEIVTKTIEKVTKVKINISGAINSGKTAKETFNNLMDFIRTVMESEKESGVEIEIVTTFLTRKFLAFRIFLKL